jgi:thiol:disulfide interchange protein DsbC
MLPKVILVFVFLTFLTAGQAFSFDPKGQDCAKCHTLKKEEAESLLKSLSQDIKVLQVEVSPLKALWEIFYEAAGRKGIVYIDFGKKFLVSGNLISFKDRANVTQDRMTALNKVDVSKIPLSDALVMGDEKAKYRVIVFTDPD